MAQKRKNLPESTIVAQGANWKIERNRYTGDYWAFVDERGFIGARPTQAAARMLIAEYNIPEAS